MSPVSALRTNKKLTKRTVPTVNLLVYFTPDKEFYVLKSIDAVKDFLNKTDDITVKNFFVEYLSKNNQIMLPI